jgi:hypothetical protein
VFSGDSESFIGKGVLCVCLFGGSKCDISLFHQVFSSVKFWGISLVKQEIPDVVLDVVKLAVNHINDLTEFALRNITSLQFFPQFISICLPNLLQNG